MTHIPPLSRTRPWTKQLPLSGSTCSSAFQRIAHEEKLAWLQRAGQDASLSSSPAAETLASLKVVRRRSDRPSSPTVLNGPWGSRNSRCGSCTQVSVSPSNRFLALPGLTFSCYVELGKGLLLPLSFKMSEENARSNFPLIFELYVQGDACE